MAIIHPQQEGSGGHPLTDGEHDEIGREG